MKRRISESSFGSLTRSIADLHRDVLAFQAKTEQRFDKINGSLDRTSRLDRIETRLKRLREDMPGIVGSAMREVERERRKSRKAP